MTISQWTQTEPEYRGWVRAMHTLVLATQRLMAPVSRRGGDRLLEWCVEFYSIDSVEHEWGLRGMELHSFLT